jgi:hypothetical protein
MAQTAKTTGTADPSTIPSPRPLRANLCSRICFFYLSPLLARGASSPLTFPDMFPLPEDHASRLVYGDFSKAWKEQLRERGATSANIWLALYAAVGWRFWASAAAVL